jgi:hypothetical protein
VLNLRFREGEGNSARLDTESELELKAIYLLTKVLSGVLMHYYLFRTPLYQKRFTEENKSVKHLSLMDLSKEVISFEVIW